MVGGGQVKFIDNEQTPEEEKNIEKIRNKRDKNKERIDRDFIKYQLTNKYKLIKKIKKEEKEEKEERKERRKKKRNENIKTKNKINVVSNIVSDLRNDFYNTVYKEVQDKNKSGKLESVLSIVFDIKHDKFRKLIISIIEYDSGINTNWNNVSLIINNFSNSICKLPIALLVYLFMERKFGIMNYTNTITLKKYFDSIDDIIYNVKYHLEVEKVILNNM